MEPGREPAEVQAYRKLLTASSEHFNILRSAPAFSHDEHWDTQYQKVRKDTRDDTDERARLHRDGRGRRPYAPSRLPPTPASHGRVRERAEFRAGFFRFLEHHGERTRRGRASRPPVVPPPTASPPREGLRVPP